MENAIEYFESQEDALEFAKCLDCVNYLVDQKIIKPIEAYSTLYNKFYEYTYRSIQDLVVRRELFLSVVYSK